MHSPPTSDEGPKPARAGIGLKSVHYQDILDTRPEVGWFEVHPENYMCAGGPPHRYLTAVREHYPLSLHSVGCSLGAAEPADTQHLARLAALVDRYQPMLVSDHVSWSALDGTYYNDLLPLPYTEESLDALCRNVDAMQEAVGRRILIENPSVYMAFDHSPIPEPEFLMEATRRTGCGLLLDVNNVFVSASNQGFDAAAYLAAIAPEAVGELHLAGHSVCERDGIEIRIDDHGSAVCDPVWELFAATAARMPNVPVLVEWDSNIPPLEVWLAEADRANSLIPAAADERRVVPA